MTLRVAIVTGNYNTVVDGVALILNRYVNALLESGAAVRVYAPVAARPAVVPHAGDLVPVPSLPIVVPYRLALGLTPTARADLVRFRPNLIYLATPDWLGVAVQAWARRRKIPVVSTFFTHFGRYLRYYGLGFLESAYGKAIRWFYRRCRAVYVPCPSIIGDLRNAGIEANFVDMPFGVDAERFTPAKRNLDWRRKWGFRPDECVMLFVGRLVWEKGLATFAETANALAARGVPHRVLIVGEGPADPNFRKRLPHAVFAGRLMGDELPTAFASADLFFFPSASETFGLVTLEALASGLACVVADAAGSRDIVRQGIDGVVCPPNEVAAFANELERLIASPSLRARFGNAGVNRAVAFGWPRVLERTVRAFHIDAGFG